MSQVPADNVVWTPFPNSSQELALDTRCDDTLLTGTRGGGKTEVQLMRFRRWVGVGFGAAWRGIIFDLEYKSLDDIVNKSKRLFGAFDDGAEFKRSRADYKWEWPTGEEFLIRQMKDPEDYWQYHGHEYPWIGWNELTKYPTPECFNVMLSCNRSGWKPTAACPHEIPLEIFSTTNPYGAGHAWVKRKYIDPAPYGKVVRNEFKITPYGANKPVTITRKQVALFSSFRENPYLDSTYEANLMRVNDPNRRAAWLTGSWDITSGGIIDDLWDTGVHRVPRFKVPANWPVDRSFDWGSSTPFSVGWWTVANGETVIREDGSEWTPARGSLIRIGEWYGTTEIGTNEGLLLASGQIAEGIHEREKQMMDEGWITRKPSPGPADSSIYDVREADTDSIAQKMKAAGIEWLKADKSKGSRVNGLQLVRDMLRASIDGEGRGLYVTDNNPAWLSLVPGLPRDAKNSDDADTDAEDHNYDETRYRVLHLKKEFAKIIRVKFPVSA